MAESERASGDADTELIPAVENREDVPRTLELPPVPTGEQAATVTARVSRGADSADRDGQDDGAPSRIGQIPTGLSRDRALKEVQTPLAAPKAPFGWQLPAPAAAPAPVELDVIPPAPAPVPEPAPAPSPEPAPEPEPEPIPAPVPDPVPAPVPEPLPAPAPEPAPEPLPDPMPAPAPAPLPEPAPAPVPQPLPPAPALGTQNQPAHGDPVQNQPAPSRPAPNRPAWATPQNLVIAAGVALVVLVLGVLVVTQGAGSGRSPTSSASSGQQAATTTLDASVSSLDPVGGSGFRRSGGSWVTQTYTSPDFGNLKDGVGLVLDLGAPHTVSSVRFDAGSGPLTVDLRAGDAKGSFGGFERVRSAGSASGATTLKGQAGGKHRYWMIWVSHLGSDNQAQISDIIVKGR